MTAALDPDEIVVRWRTLRAFRPTVRTCEAAAELGVTEAELLASMAGDGAVRLDANPGDLLYALTEVGRCTAVTRNPGAKSEVRGRYAGIELGPRAGQVTGERFELRVFLDHWRHLFALEQPDPQRRVARRRSIHVFDRAGAAVHAIYLEPEGDHRTWDAIVATRATTAPLVLEPAPLRRDLRIDAAIDRAVLLAEWDEMQDTHEFFHLLARYGVTRTQALRLAGETRARQVADDAIERVMEAASASGDPLMIFVGNPGCHQAFSGAIDRVARHGPWLDVLDPGFNLHLRCDRIASSWVVRKPTRAGVVSSLELFDSRGEVLALVFRARGDRERPEDAAWRALLAGLPGWQPGAPR